MSRVQSHILTLPLIDEDDEDENGHIPLPLRVSSYLVERKVQNDNLINLNAGSSNNHNLCNIKKTLTNANSNNDSLTTGTTLSLTSSPKIKVSRIKFTQSPQQQQQQPLPSPLSASSSNDPESLLTTTQNQNQETSSTISGETSPSSKMQAESGSIAELQKYQNKYLKNRRHTLANTAAITLR